MYWNVNCKYMIFNFSEDADALSLDLSLNKSITSYLIFKYMYANVKVSESFSKKDNLSQPPAMYLVGIMTIDTLNPKVCLVLAILSLYIPKKNQLYILCYIH